MESSRDTGEGKRPGLIRRALRFVYVLIRNYFAVIGLLVTLIGIQFAMSLAGGKAAASLDIRPGTDLRLDLTGKVAEREPGIEAQLMRRFFGGDKQVYLPELR